MGLLCQLSLYVYRSAIMSYKKKKNLIEDEIFLEEVYVY